MEARLRRRRRDSSEGYRSVPDWEATLRHWQGDYPHALIKQMIYNHVRRAYHKAHRFGGHAYHEARKYAAGFDQCTSAAGQTVLTLEPLLDEVAPRARRTLTQGLEDYGIARSKVMHAHN